MVAKINLDGLNLNLLKKRQEHAPVEESIMPMVENLAKRRQEIDAQKQALVDPSSTGNIINNLSNSIFGTAITAGQAEREQARQHLNANMAIFQGRPVQLERQPTYMEMFEKNKQALNSDYAMQIKQQLELLDGQKKDLTTQWGEDLAAKTYDSQRIDKSEDRNFRDQNQAIDTAKFNAGEENKAKQAQDKLAFDYKKLASDQNIARMNLADKQNKAEDSIKSEINKDFEGNRKGGEIFKKASAIPAVYQYLQHQLTSLRETGHLGAVTYPQVKEGIKATANVSGARYDTGGERISYEKSFIPKIAEIEETLKLNANEPTGKQEGRRILKQVNEAIFAGTGQVQTAIIQEYARAVNNKNLPEEKKKQLVLDYAEQNLAIPLQLAEKAIVIKNRPDGTNQVYLDSNKLPKELNILKGYVAAYGGDYEKGLKNFLDDKLDGKYDENLLLDLEKQGKLR